MREKVSLVTSIIRCLYGAEQRGGGTQLRNALRIWEPHRSTVLTSELFITPLLYLNYKQYVN